MTYYGSKNLAGSFRTVRRNTIAIAEEIPVAQYAFRAAPGTMSAGEMLAHVAASYAWQKDVHRAHMTSIPREFFMSERQKSAADEAALAAKGKDAIIGALKERGDAFAAFLESLDENTLAEIVSFPEPMPSKSRFEMLLGVKEHEMHHRGQLMLVQRILGMVPPLTRAREQMIAQAHAAR